MDALLAIIKVAGKIFGQNAQQVNKILIKPIKRLNQ
jgi:hypothetical protein